LALRTNAAGRRDARPESASRSLVWFVRVGGWLAAAAGAVCFLSTLSGDFVLDDGPIIVQNPRVQSLSHLGQIWRSDWWQPPDPYAEPATRWRDLLYRPLTMTTFALNYAVGQLDPRGYHAVNVLLHATACFLVWALGRRLLGDPEVATIAALLFAVHPVHVEAVAGIVGRAEILATIFMALGLLVLLPADRPAGRGRALGAAVLFLAATFSKETAVCYPLVALVALHGASVRPLQNPRRWWLMHAGALLLPLMVYLSMRYYACGGHLMRPTPPLATLNPLAVATPAQRLLHSLTVLGHYVRLLISPGKMSCSYGLAVIDARRGPELMTWVGAAAIVAAGVALWGYLRPKGPWRQMAVLTAMTAAAYGLISNTLLVIGVSVAERLMYWPSVPFLLAASLGLIHGYRICAARGWLSAQTAAALRMALVLVFAALGVRSQLRNRDWASDLALFDRDAQNWPQCVPIRTGAAKVLLRQVLSGQAGQDAAALLRKIEEHAAAAARICPDSWSAWLIRGQALALLGEHAAATSALELAGRLNPWDRLSRQLLTELRAEVGGLTEQLQMAAARAASQPDNIDARLEYVELLLRAQRFSEAVQQAQRAVELAPQNARAWRLLGDSYAGLAEVERAVAALRQAALLEPANWQTHLNLSTLLSLTDRAGALEHAERAWRLAPQRVETGLALAAALGLNGRAQEAVRLYRQVEQALAPDDPLRAVIESYIRDLEGKLP
jgi:Flp pilus assembly protein TadD